VGPPHGWSFGAIREPDISERTLLRYVAVRRRELVDGAGRPLLAVVCRGEQHVLRLSAAARGADSTSHQVISFYLALTILQFPHNMVSRAASRTFGRASTGPSHRSRCASSTCRGARYLIGNGNHYQKIIRLVMGQIRKARGYRTPFEYPPRCSPERCRVRPAQNIPRSSLTTCLFLQ